MVKKSQYLLEAFYKVCISRKIKNTVFEEDVKRTTKVKELFYFNNMK
jgi:hypothetical protein